MLLCDLLLLLLVTVNGSVVEGEKVSLARMLRALLVLRLANNRYFVPFVVVVKTAFKLAWEL